MCLTIISAMALYENIIILYHRNSSVSVYWSRTKATEYYQIINNTASYNYSSVAYARGSPTLPIKLVGRLLFGAGLGELVGLQT